MTSMLDPASHVLLDREDVLIYLYPRLEPKSAGRAWASGALASPHVPFDVPLQDLEATATTAVLDRRVAL